MRQDAPKNGALFFELRTAEGNSTHAGSLDFSAPEGTVFLPHQVVANLWADGVIPENVQLNVRYKRLEKGKALLFLHYLMSIHHAAGLHTLGAFRFPPQSGLCSLVNLFMKIIISIIQGFALSNHHFCLGTYVRLQPATANFHQEVGDSMEEILVAALSKRSAVSVGDTLLVDGLDQPFELKVQQLLPAAQVSVIGELPMSILPMTPS